MQNKEYLAYNEIHFSYRVMEKTMDRILESADEIKAFFKDAEKVVFLGCGSSYWMSLSAAKTLSFHTGMDALALKAADIVMCPEEYRQLGETPVFVAPSRSGRSKDVLMALDILKKYYPSSRLFTVTEYPDTPLQEISDLDINTPWANEDSVCQTRSFDSLWTAFLTITAILSGKRELIDEMKDYFSLAPELYIQGEKKVQELLEGMGDLQSLVTLGAGRQYGIVIEGAYISIEMAQTQSNYYQLLEYRHGPIVTARKGVLALICSTGADDLSYEAKMAEEIRNEGATVAAVALKEGICDNMILLPKPYSPEVISLYFIFIAQSIAYYSTIRNQKDPDHPGDLVPFITY